MIHPEGNPRAMRHALLLLVLVLAGCAGRGGEPELAVGAPIACEAQDAGEPGANAPLIITLQDDPEVVAGRFAEAIGKPLDGPPEPMPEGALRWRLGDGTLDVIRQEDGDVWLQHLAPGAVSAEEGNAWLDALARAFDVQAERSTREDGVLLLAQAYAGRPVHGTDARLFLGPGLALDFGPFYEFAHDVEALPDAQLETKAAAHAQCLAERHGQPAIEGAKVGDYAVRAESLVRVVHARFPQTDPMCSDAYEVYVDVATGAVHDAQSPTCA